MNEESDVEDIARMCHEIFSGDGEEWKDQSPRYRSQKRREVRQVLAAFKILKSKLRLDE